MKNKVCIITGFTSGIGNATAYSIANKGAKLGLLCRNKERGEKVINDIERITNNTNLSLFIAELSSQKEIRRVAEEIKTKFPVIDILINNAGGINEKRELTEDGIEKTFAVNHIAYFLLTNLLLENLKASQNARIINVASDAHHYSKIEFDDLSMEKGYNHMKAYSMSKLANILFTYELAKKLQDTNVTVNCMHPGGVNTNFGKDMKFPAGAYFRLSPFSRKPEKGAETIIWMADSPELIGVTGKYFMDKKEIKSNKLSHDNEIQEKLWEVSEKMTGIN